MVCALKNYDLNSREKFKSKDSSVEKQCRNGEFWILKGSCKVKQKNIDSTLMVEQIQAF